MSKSSELDITGHNRYSCWSGQSAITCSVPNLISKRKAWCTLQQTPSATVPSPLLTGHKPPSLGSEARTPCF
ncbi:hypothetical protein I79_013144 [Cricetulus griseus]|uniref:Uncharacterized protein n=1 Tax=Cricetulus griseus TaxID=10029 RepID=G3HQN9_CRIGR|nr:hypothetical protein I79_013144 [Cricetulus griseus]